LIASIAVEAWAERRWYEWLMTQPIHEYATRIVWEGNLGQGTTSYATYGRGYRISVAGKPDLTGTADPAFRGERDKHNPEDLFLAAVSACHMLSYLALCARHGVHVAAYEDDATGTLKLDATGGGRFEAIALHPKVTVARAADATLATSLHAQAHELCFIARSCAVPIRHFPTVQVRAPEASP
jgi:organic hydroperoxide reductase OsmC/OhrA